MQYKSLILLPIALIMLSGCQGRLIQQVPAASPRQSNMDQSIHCPTHNEEARLSYNRGVDRANQGDPEEAIQAFQKAIALEPKYCDAMINMAQLLRNQGKLDEAIFWYKKSIEIFPDNPVAHNGLATALRKQGKTKEAAIEHQWLIRANAEDPEAYFGLGIDYMEMEEFKRAIKPLKKAEQLYAQNASPRLVDARHALGVASYKLKDFERSRYYFEQIYDQFQDDVGINYALGLCYVFEGKDLNEARKYLRKAKELGAQIPADLEKKIAL